MTWVAAKRRGLRAPIDSVLTTRNMLAGLLLSLGLFALTLAAPKPPQDDGPRMYDLPGEEEVHFTDEAQMQPEEPQDEQSEVQYLVV